MKNKNVETPAIATSKFEKFDFSEIGISSEKKTSNKSLYKGLDGMTTEDKKRHRSKIRRTLDNLMKEILGKDRTDAEREKGISEFMIFYKENWKITDFRIETFSEKSNEADLKNYRNLLAVVKEFQG